MGKQRLALQPGETFKRARNEATEKMERKWNLGAQASIPGIPARRSGMSKEVQRAFLDLFEECANDYRPIRIFWSELIKVYDNTTETSPETGKQRLVKKLNLDRARETFRSGASLLPKEINGPWWESIGANGITLQQATELIPVLRNAVRSHCRIQREAL